MFLQFTDRSGFREEKLIKVGKVLLEKFNIKIKKVDNNGNVFLSISGDEQNLEALSLILSHIKLV